MDCRFKQIFEVFFSALKSEHTVDAVRNTFAVVLPVVVFLNLGWQTMAVGVSVGALMICMTDLPGNRKDKFQAAWISILLLSCVALITSLLATIPVLMIAFVVALTFFCTMLGVFGARLGAIGLMAIILATFTIGLQLPNPWLYSFYIFLGGCWYTLISLLQILIFPYRSLNRIIATTQKQTAALLQLRAEGYNPAINLTGFNQRNIALHLKLAGCHELIRQLLLSDNKALSGNAKGNALLEKAINLMDLYEEASAVHYDYPFLRKQFENTAALPLIEQLIKLLAKKLSNFNLKKYTTLYDTKRDELQLKLQELPAEQAKLLAQILANIDEIHLSVLAINNASEAKSVSDNTSRYQDFLTLSPIKVETFTSHFNLKSPIFRFSLRLSALALVALVLITILAKEHYTYWLLLTMVIVSRPNYSHTLKRNLERLIGTILGLVLGWLISTYCTQTQQLYISVAALFVFFVFNRIAYGLCVVGITIAVILCLHAYQGDLWHLLSDRAVFTLLGLALCVAATFLFPIWNAPRITDLVKDVIYANMTYFNSVTKINPNHSDTIHKSRLARKLSHQKLLALSEAIQAASKEPWANKVNWNLIYSLQVTSYQLNVLIASYAGVKKQGASYLLANDIKVIENNFDQIASSIENLNLNKNLVLPTRSGEGMSLKEISQRLADFLITAK